MNSNTPDGSTITIFQHNGHEMITIPHSGSSGSVLEYFQGLFILFWLGFWLMSHLLLPILAGVSPYDMFSLGIFGGLLPACWAYLIFRFPIPEKLLLNMPNLTYDSGMPPTSPGFFNWGVLFQKRKKHEFLPSHIQTLTLRDIDGGGGIRLTVDMGAQQIEICKGVSEIEKEWLYDYLQQKYANVAANLKKLRQLIHG
jgi:hypothetical protein